MTDTFKHKGLRKQLIDSIREKGIKNKPVLNAMLKVPRHYFMDNAFLNFAYQDKAFPIGNGQTISQPFTVAFQTELLGLKHGHKVLEIGTGSGYQTCVLLELGARVYTIERQRALYHKTRILLPAMGYTPKFFYGDGYKGLPAFAPFDRILVTAGATFVPQELIKQLKPGGKLVIPVGDSQSQEMHLIDKGSDDACEITVHGTFSFVPLLNNKEI